MQEVRRFDLGRVPGDKSANVRGSGEQQAGRKSLLMEEFTVSLTVVSTAN
jgi:hypothetical protein